MTKSVIFRDYQEQQAGDHNNLQDFTREAIGFVSRDAITATPRFAGFQAIKTGQIQLQVAPGRMYDADGMIYAKRETLTQSLSTYLPITAMRFVTLSVFGQVNDVDVQERDFVVNVETRATDPDSIAMTRSRDAVLVFTPGAESAEPLPAAPPANHVPIAHVLLDTTQIVSIAMLTENEVASTEGLDRRTDDLEEFRSALEPRLLGLAAQIAKLEKAISEKGDAVDVSSIYYDLALVKEAVEMPEVAVDYGADRFLDYGSSDKTNALNLGWNARIEEGIRFPWANVSVKEMKLFSANDPNAKVTDGFVLPAYTDELKLAVSDLYQSLGIAQYGFQTHDLVKKEMSRQVIRYGQTFTACTNSSWWNGVQWVNQQQLIFQRGGETFQIEAGSPIPTQLGGTTYGTVRYDQIWIDTVSETYWDIVTTDIRINGAMVAQTFLVPNDMWATKLGFYLAEKAAQENIFLTIAEITAGVPDLSKVIAHQTINAADLVAGQWIRPSIKPTFLVGGKRYAILLTSNANNKIGMAFGQSYVDGTFFYSTDSAWFQGDLTKDMMFEVWGARFNAPQVTIELEAWNLDGGIKAVMANMDAVAPKSTELVFEVQPNGSGEWIPFRPETDAFALTPPLVRARLRFVGSRDMMPGLRLTGSELTLARPAVAFTHVSTMRSLGTASNDITVRAIVESFNDTPHDFSCELWKAGSPMVKVNPTTTSVKTMDADAGRYEYTFKFVPGGAITQFALVFKGATNSAGNTFHVAQRVYYSK
jgi:hypothetical protein